MSVTGPSPQRGPSGWWVWGEGGWEWLTDTAIADAEAVAAAYTPPPQRGEGGWWLPDGVSGWLWQPDGQRPPLPPRVQRWAGIWRMFLISAVLAVVGAIFTYAAADDRRGGPDGDPSIAPGEDWIASMLYVAAVIMFVIALGKAIAQLGREESGV